MLLGRVGLDSPGYLGSPGGVGGLCSLICLSSLSCPTSPVSLARFLSLLLHSLDYRFKKKKPATSYSRTGESRTTLGDGALNFRVRNGNGCDNSSMATGKKPLFELGTKEKYNFWRDERGWNPLSRKVKFLIYI